MSDDSKSAKAANQDSSSQPAPVSDQPTRRALLVEDSLPQRRLLKKLLESEGFVVAEAADGKEGEHCLQEAGVEGLALIVCDLIMPKVGGFEFLTAAREKYGDDLPPILVCSALSDRETMAVLKKIPVSGYILKPYKTSTVIEKLRQLSQEKGAETEKRSGHA